MISHSSFDEAWIERTRAFLKVIILGDEKLWQKTARSLVCHLLYLV